MPVQGRAPSGRAGRAAVASQPPRLDQLAASAPPATPGAPPRSDASRDPPPARDRFRGHARADLSPDHRPTRSLPVAVVTPALLLSRAFDSAVLLAPAACQSQPASQRMVSGRSRLSAAISAISSMQVSDLTSASALLLASCAIRAEQGPWSRRRDARTTTKAGVRRSSRAGPTLAPPRLLK